MFLHKRLFGGERLDEAWTGYLQSFRARWVPTSIFCAVIAISVELSAQFGSCRLELPLLHGDRGALRKLLSAQTELLRFDRQAGGAGDTSAAYAARSRTDRASGAVGTRRAAGQPGPLDAVEITEPEEPVLVAVYRTDLLLILKNLLRNAILAVGRCPAPRQIAVDVVLELLPTGEEVVKLRVHDSSPETLTPEQIYRSGDAAAQGAQHGLSLVTAALSLYSGSISVGAGRAGYQKCVIVQLFRAFDGAAPEEAE